MDNIGGMKKDVLLVLMMTQMEINGTTVDLIVIAYIMILMEHKARLIVTNQRKKR